MRAAEWKRLIKPLLDDRWAVSGRLAYVRPEQDDEVLTGVFAERSSGDWFYLWQFRLPLHAPSNEDLNLSWSNRIGGGGGHYYVDDPDSITTIREAMRTALKEAARKQTIIDQPDSGPRC